MAKANMPTILIVDDDPGIRKMIAEVLTLEGFPYESAAEGGEALALIAQGGPRIILLDLLMEPVNGRDVMLALEANGDRSRHKIIFVSAISTLNTHRDLNPDATLAKPFTVPQLLSVLESVSVAA